MLQSMNLRSFCSLLSFVITFSEPGKKLMKYLRIIAFLSCIYLGNPQIFFILFSECLNVCLTGMQLIIGHGFWLLDPVLLVYPTYFQLSKLSLKQITRPRERLLIGGGEGICNLGWRLSLGLLSKSRSILKNIVSVCPTSVRSGLDLLYVL